MKLRSIFLLATIVALAFLSSCGPKGKVSGTVGYFLEKDKADAGAKVYFLNSMDGEAPYTKKYVKAKVNAHVYAEWHRIFWDELHKEGDWRYFQFTDETGKLFEDTVVPKDSMPDDGYQKAERKKILAELKNTAGHVMEEIELYKSKGTEVVTDANGKYSVKLKPGKYFVLFVSDDLKGKAPVESQGLIEAEVIEVKADVGQTVNGGIYTPIGLNVK